MAGATRGHTRQRSATEEQRSQTAFCPKTLRAADLLPVAGVGSFLTARCGDARNSPPWPRPKSLAAGLLLILKQALRRVLKARPVRGPGLQWHWRSYGRSILGYAACPPAAHW